MSGRSNKWLLIDRFHPIGRQLYLLLLLLRWLLCLRAFSTSVFPSEPRKVGRSEIDRLVCNRQTQWPPFGDNRSSGRIGASGRLVRGRFVTEIRVGSSPDGRSLSVNSSSCWSDEYSGCLFVRYAFVSSRSERNNNTIGDLCRLALSKSVRSGSAERKSADLGILLARSYRTPLGDVQK